VLLLTASLLAGAGAWTCRILATPQPAETANPPFAAANNPKAPRDEEGLNVTVRGRFLDPDGKPGKGARLYWPRVPKTQPKDEEDIEIPQRGQTDADGRFRFELPRSDIKPEWKLSLVAAADGQPIEGRIEGRIVTN
jgi:hypothetical protein